MEDFFRKSNEWRQDRLRDLEKWKRHHEASIKDIDEQIAYLKSLPSSIGDIINKEQK